MPDEQKKTGAAAKAEEKPTAADVGEATAPKPENEEDATLTVERLITDGQVALGYNSADVAGAFAGAKPSDEVTIKDAKQRVKEWLSSPEQQDEQE